MRRTILSSFILELSLVVAPLSAGLNHWTPIGPNGGQIQALAADPQRSDTVYAGTRGGVFRSVDGGATWRRASRGLKDPWVYSLAVASSDRNVVYAGTASGLFLSRNGGKDWQGPLLPSRRILSLAVDPRDARHVWVGTDDGLAWSRDAGATWDSARLDGFLIRRIPDIAIDPVHPDTVYAANAPEEEESILGVLKTTDGGATWTLLQEGGLEALGNAFDDMRLAVDPTAPNVVYVSTQTFGDLMTFRSEDSGATWEPTPGGYPVAVDRQGVAYAGGMRGLDHGKTWEPAAAPPDLEVDYAAGGGTLWAATDSLGVFRSVDRAATWQASSEGLHATTVISIAIDPELPRVIYTGVYEMGVRKTLSSGLHWRSASSGLPSYAPRGRAPWRLTADPGRPQTVYLSWSHGFARSDDGGAHWTVLHTSFFERPETLVDPEGAVYLVGYSLFSDTCGVARSDDRGATFRCLPPFVGIAALPGVRLALDPVKPERLWVIDGQARIWKSTDRGDHWTEIRPRGLERAGAPLTLTVDPSVPGRLYIGTGRASERERPERVWRSDDGGYSWKPLGRELLPHPQASVTCLLVDPKRPAILYACAAVEQYDFKPKDSRNGVYQSRDGGRTFTRLRDGLPPGDVLDLDFDPQDSRKLYAATWYNGVYTFTQK